jgi:hypothetical protein
MRLTRKLIEIMTFKELLNQDHRLWRSRRFHENGARGAVRRLLSDSFWHGVIVQRMREHHPNEVLDHFGGDGNAIERYFEDRFEILDELGINRREFFDNIRKGMTEQEFLGQPCTWAIRRRAKAPVSRTATVQAEPAIEDEPVPSPELDLREQIKLILIQNANLRTLIRQLRRDLAVALAEGDRRNRLFDRLDKGFQCVNKIIDTTKRKAV